MRKDLVRIAGTVIASTALALSLAGCSSADNASGSTTTTANAGTEASADAYVDVDWLKANAESVIILDARSVDDFMTQHIPGAVNLHWTDASNVVEVEQGQAGWAELLEPADLAVAISRLGIDNSKPVVVYTDTTDGWGEDGRMYWTLREAGVEDVRMLAGGWTQWLYNQGSHASGLKSKDMDAIDQVDIAYVKQSMGSAVLVDARSPEEYAGETTMGEAREGRIPGAVNVAYVDLVNEDGTMKAADELESMFSEAGLAKDDPIIVYCTGGVRAAAVAEALSSAGYTDVSIFTAGFSEWAGDPANPVEVG